MLNDGRTERASAIYRSAASTPNVVRDASRSAVAMTRTAFAWELVDGPLPSAQRDLLCATNPSCVRVDHFRSNLRNRLIRSERKGHAHRDRRVSCASVMGIRVNEGAPKTGALVER
jgi:hypothetical protein